MTGWRLRSFKLALMTADRIEQSDLRRLKSSWLSTAVELSGNGLVSMMMLSLRVKVCLILWF